MTKKEAMEHANACVQEARSWLAESPDGARIKDAIAALVRALEWKAAAQVLKK